MDRLIAPGSVAQSQAPVPPTTGTPQFAANGTVWPPYQYNAVQEELLAIQSAAGLTNNNQNNGQIIQALGILFGGGGVLSGNGWQKLPGGLIIQWGSGSTTSGNQDTVTLPEPYPNAHFQTVVSEGSSQGWVIGGAIDPVVYGVTSLTLVGFKVSAARIIMTSSEVSFQAGLNYRYMSIGN